MKNNILLYSVILSLSLLAVNTSISAIYWVYLVEFNNMSTNNAILETIDFWAIIGGICTTLPLIVIIYKLIENKYLINKNIK